jgi:hypothetical protein
MESVNVQGSEDLQQRKKKLYLEQLCFLTVKLGQEVEQRHLRTDMQEIRTAQAGVCVCVCVCV